VAFASLAFALVVGLSATSQAQTEPETTTTTEAPTTTVAPTTTLLPTNNFLLAGVRDLTTGEMVSIDQDVTGEFAHCANPNGLGAEAYLNAGNPSGLQVRHATVTPFVVPIHIGLLQVNNPDPGASLNEEMLTLGVVAGDTVQFGTTGFATAEYSGLFFGTTAAGVVNWRQSETITCTDSLVMPISHPLRSGAPPTTLPPA
jgi:hypothetical protein